MSYSPKLLANETKVHFILMYLEKVNNLIRKFGNHLIVDKGFGYATAKGYERCMSIAIRRMKKLNPQYKEIQVYILWLRKKNYSYNHIVNTSLAIEHFTDWQGHPVKLGRPKKPKTIIKNTLTEAEVSRIIQGCRTIRQQAVICTLAFSGIRNQELCNLKLENIDFGTNEIRVLSGKNSKDRIVNISGDCIKVLIDYLKEHSREEDDYLFTNLQTGKKINPGIVRKIIKTIAKEAKITKRVFPHLFRHSLAMNFLKRGASIMLVKDQLGHSFIETTMIYVHSNLVRNKTEYDYYKPAYL